MPDRARHRVVRQTGRSPAVETDRGELAFEHGRRVEEDAGRLDAAGEHRQRLGVEVEVVGLARGHRGGERVPVASAGAPDALQVVRLTGRHRAEHHGREIADVDAEFQRGRRRQQVRLPGPRVRCGEALLQAVAFRAGEQRGVLGRDQPADDGLAVQATEPGRSLHGVTLVDGLHAEVQTRDAQPQVRFVLRHDEGPVRSGAVHHRGACGDVEARRIERPGAIVPPGFHPADETGRFERLEQLQQDARRLVCRGEDVDGR